MQSVLHNEIYEEAEKLCLKCGEIWPETDEFFPRLPNGTFHSPCKACTDEHRRTVTALKPCCVPGCNNPRYHWRYARCWEHRLYLKVNPSPRVYKRKQAS